MSIKVFGPIVSPQNQRITAHNLGKYPYWYGPQPNVPHGKRSSVISVREYGDGIDKKKRDDSRGIGSAPNEVGHTTTVERARRH